MKDLQDAKNASLANKYEAVLSGLIQKGLVMCLGVQYGHYHYSVAI